MNVSMAELHFTTNPKLHLATKYSIEKVDTSQTFPESGTLVTTEKSLFSYEDTLKDTDIGIKNT